MSLLEEEEVETLAALPDQQEEERDAQIERLRSDPRTYTDGLDKNDQIKEFLMYFYKHIAYHREDEMKQLQTTHPETVGKFYQQFVITEKRISHEAFWQRYYFRVKSIEDPSIPNGHGSNDNSGDQAPAESPRHSTYATESTMELLHLAQTRSSQRQKKKDDQQQILGQESDPNLDVSSTSHDGIEPQEVRESWLNQQQGGLDSDDDDELGAANHRPSSLLEEDEEEEDSDGKEERFDSIITNQSARGTRATESTMELLKLAHARTDKPLIDDSHTSNGGTDWQQQGGLDSYDDDDDDDDGDDDGDGDGDDDDDDDNDLGAAKPRSGLLEEEDEDGLVTNENTKGGANDSTMEVLKQYHTHVDNQLPKKFEDNQLEEDKTTNHDRIDATLMGDTSHQSLQPHEEDDKELLEKKPLSEQEELKEKEDPSVVPISASDEKLSDQNQNASLQQQEQPAKDQQKGQDDVRGGEQDSTPTIVSEHDGENKKQQQEDLVESDNKSTLGVPGAEGGAGGGAADETTEEARVDDAPRSEMTPMPNMFEEAMDWTMNLWEALVLDITDPLPEQTEPNIVVSVKDSLKGYGGAAKDLSLNGGNLATCLEGYTCQSSVFHLELPTRLSEIILARIRQVVAILRTHQNIKTVSVIVPTHMEEQLSQDPDVVKMFEAIGALPLLEELKIDASSPKQRSQLAMSVVTAAIQEIARQHNHDDRHREPLILTIHNMTLIDTHEDRSEFQKAVSTLQMIPNVRVEMDVALGQMEDLFLISEGSQSSLMMDPSTVDDER